MKPIYPQQLPPNTILSGQPMLIKSNIRELLSKEELNILDVHGDLLQALANGEVLPSTENQSRFVSEIKGELESAIGKASKAWLKYVKLNEMLIKISSLQMSVKLKDEEIKELNINIEKANKEQKAMETFIDIIKSDLRNRDKFRLDENALSKLTKENRETLKKFEHAIALKEIGVISKSRLDELSAISGLWKALHNYEKMLHPLSHLPYASDRARHHLEICNSCGAGIIDGHCKCSN